MAKRNKSSDDAPTTPAPFAVDPNANTGAPPSDNSDDDEHDPMDDIGHDEPPPPLGIQPVMFVNAKPAGDTGKYIIELALESAEFEGEEPLQIWCDPNDRKDIRRVKSICAAFGESWNPELGRPSNGWKSLRNKRARAIIGIWEKDTGEIEFQVSKYPPMFSMRDEVKTYREAFIASCHAAGIASAELVPIKKGKHKGKVTAKSKPNIFGGCGILPISESYDH